MLPKIQAMRQLQQLNVGPKLTYSDYNNTAPSPSQSFRPPSKLQIDPDPETSPRTGETVKSDASIIQTL